MNTRLIDLLTSAGYTLQFYTASKDASLSLPVAPAIAITWDNHHYSCRGVESSDALLAAVKYITTEVEQKRLEELQRRGALHAKLLAELERGAR